MSGLVEQIHGRGVLVRQPSANTLLALFELMAELESAGGRFAAMRISESAVDQLQQANENCQVAMLAGQADNYYYTNRIFHSVIYRESGNSALETEAIKLHQKFKAYRRLQLQFRGRMSQPMSVHQEIIKAPRLADSEKAAQLLRGHVAVQGETFHSLLSSFNELQPQSKVLAPY